MKLHAPYILHGTAFAFNGSQARMQR